MQVVVYYRRGSGESGASKDAICHGQDAVQAWTAARQADVIETRTEASRGEAQPGLDAAVEASKARGATLLIAAAAPICTGAPFEPRIAEVPVEVVSPVPDGAPAPLCLHVLRGPDWPRIVVYLCNAGTEPLADVVVNGAGVMLERGDLALAKGREKALGTLAPQTCVLIGAHDTVYAGDILVSYLVKFTDAAGRARSGTAVVETGQPEGPWKSVAEKAA